MIASERHVPPAVRVQYALEELLAARDAAQRLVNEPAPPVAQLQRAYVRLEMAVLACQWAFGRVLS